MITLSEVDDIIENIHACADEDSDDMYMDCMYKQLNFGDTFKATSLTSKFDNFERYETVIVKFVDALGVELGGNVRDYLYYLDNMCAIKNYCSGNRVMNDSNYLSLLDSIYDAYIANSQLQYADIVKIAENHTLIDKEEYLRTKVTRNTNRFSAMADSMLDYTKINNVKYLRLQLKDYFECDLIALEKLDEIIENVKENLYCDYAIAIKLSTGGLDSISEYVTKEQCLNGEEAYYMTDIAKAKDIVFAYVENYLALKNYVN